MGLFVWTFAEYVIHGWLSHTFKTFATPIHNGHHRDPHNVFAVRTWLPLAIIWSGAIGIWGFASGVVFLSGILAGFAAYEWLHYRIHFAVPGSSWESWLRTRHLIHHRHAANRGFGVTTSIWDLVFGSDLSLSKDWVYAEEAARTPPLTGPSNLRKILRFDFQP
ncbi:MAG TPA: sterol desaturase family protein [Candidatus Binataceae bacterium]|nr:sterol desaturase family protein [Candidatus Binataceae bacterium]